METLSTHPYEPFVPNGATRLIIGTIPPPNFCKEERELKKGDVDFYYGSGVNTLWTMIEEINKISLNTIEKRKNFLESVNIGITDIVKTCTRKKKSASDEDLENIEYKDIKKLLKENPLIDTLLYTSHDGKGNVETLMRECLKDEYKNIKKDRKKRYPLKIDGKIYSVVILTSPSRTVIRYGGENAGKERLEAYTAIFKN